MRGRILKGIGGFYYVESEGKLYECRARGIFRKRKITPLPGDFVEFSLHEDEDGNVDEILPRKNYLIRPAVANIDRLFIVASVTEPQPNYFIIDKTIATAEDRGIEPVLVITKTDLTSPDEFYSVYRSCGFRTVLFSAETGEGEAQLREILREGGVSAFTGNSGVGKSSMINYLYPGFSLETGEISEKLGRGRHTTRSVELLALPEGGYAADTPGFSSLEFDRFDLIRKENLPFCFREFAPYLGKCRFASDCSHTVEKGCAVIEAVNEGKIHPSRHKSYVQMFEEVRDLKDWQLPKER